ncbi:MAG: lipopolysaccharide biosynthesis protein [Gammaproteobacteria bacterium]
MMSDNLLLKKVFSATYWGMFSTVVAGVVQLMIVPLLIGTYGKANYGLMMLAFSIFTYLRLLDFGMLSGSIRYGAMWLSTDKSERIESLFQTNVFFFAVIGFLSALILIWLGNNAGNLFNLNPEQESLFKWMMWILAFNAVLDCLSTVFNILFSAHQEVAWIGKTVTVKNIVLIATILYVVTFNISLIWYFLTHTIASIAQFLLYLVVSYRKKLLFTDYLKPKFNKNIFKEVFSYSLSLFSMRVFQISALYLRPIMIGIVTVDSVLIIADYTIIQTICTLVIAFSGVFAQILLPLMSKSIALEEHEKISQILHRGTKYISIFVVSLICILVINIEQILELYVGSEYTHLSSWAIVALITLLSLHSAPVSSFIMASGRLTPLIIFSALNAMASLGLIALLVPEYDVGGAIISFLIYTIFQQSFIYGFYIRKYFKIPVRMLLMKGFLSPVFAGAIAVVCSLTLVDLIYIETNVVQILFNSSLFALIYVSLCLGFIVKPKEVRELFMKFFNGKV